MSSNNRAFGAKLKDIPAPLFCHPREGEDLFCIFRVNKVAQEHSMSDWLFKSWIKVSVVTVILFFFYHLFISLKLEQEDFKNNSNDQE